MTILEVLGIADSTAQPLQSSDSNSLKLEIAIDGTTTASEMQPSHSDSAESTTSTILSQTLFGHLTPRPEYHIDQVSILISEEPSSTTIKTTIATTTKATRTILNSNIDERVSILRTHRIASTAETSNQEFDGISISNDHFVGKTGQRKTGEINSRTTDLVKINDSIMDNNADNEAEELSDDIPELSTSEYGSKTTDLTSLTSHRSNVRNVSLIYIENPPGISAQGDTGLIVPDAAPSVSLAAWIGAGAALSLILIACLVVLSLFTAQKIKSHRTRRRRIKSLNGKVLMRLQLSALIANDQPQSPQTACIRIPDEDNVSMRSNDTAKGHAGSRRRSSGSGRSTRLSRCSSATQPDRGDRERRARPVSIPPGQERLSPIARFGGHSPPVPLEVPEVVDDDEVEEEVKGLKGEERKEGREGKEEKQQDEEEREKERGKEREKERDKEREKEREKERDKERDKEREKERDKEREKEREKEAQKQREKERAETKEDETKQRNDPDLYERDSDAGSETEDEIFVVNIGFCNTDNSVIA